MRIDRRFRLRTRHLILIAVLAMVAVEAGIAYMLAGR